MSIPGRWVLGSPFNQQGQEIDSWQFSKGQRVELEGVPRFSMAHAGRPIDFSQTGLGVLVVHDRVVSAFERLGIQEVQFLPAQVEGQSEPWFILNILRIIRCIDDARCEYVEYWEPEDEMPDKMGQYSNVRGLKVDPARIEDAHIFRTWGWHMAIIVSEQLKQALEQEGVSGVKYIEA